jgi:membrane-associated phospholipid phosphatase
VTRATVARKVTHLLEPKNWIIVTIIAVGWHSQGLRGLGWGLLAALFAGVAPTLFISRGIRRGHWADRNVGDKRPRLLVLGFITASVAVGLVALALAGAPGELIGYFIFMLVSVAGLAIITTIWKISIHCAVASGSVTVLTLVFGPELAPAYALTAVTAWSRVELEEHTAAQVIAGSALGALAALLGYEFIPHG